MKLESLTLKNFRCFGEQPTTISLNEFTTLIGTNGCGKTAILLALSRLFGVSASERRLQRSDFHVPLNIGPDELNEISLFIEVRIAFPELELDNRDDTCDGAVAEAFHHMVIKEGGKLFCRVRLEGKWTRSNLPEGDIEEWICWIKALHDPVKYEDKQTMRAHERARVHVLYVPAARDPSTQLKYVSGSLLARLLNAISWSDDARGVIEKASQDIGSLFQAEAGLNLFHAKIGENWTALHDLQTYTTPRLRPFSNRLEEILRQVEMVFSPSNCGTEQDITQLSDGLRSLFYFALVGSIFDIEQDALAASHAAQANDDTEDSGTAPISLERLNPPALTIFCVEEPENHLAPHYLGRIMNLLQRIGERSAAQVLLTSHSASILKRVDPLDVRHCRLAPETKTAIVSRITLPAEETDAFKYIKEAVRAYPELYFARLVVLGEGDSEEIVLPRIAECLDIPIDSSMISVVPLGGRHVNHFWRLLNDLSIPFITLLDLDRERYGAGWGRIKYVCEQLLNIGKERSDILSVKNSDGTNEVITDDQFEAMHTWNVEDTVNMNAWLKDLERHDVFFSQPLDLDFTMLQSFIENYKSLIPPRGGPRLLIPAALEAVLGSGGSAGSTYNATEQSLFPLYAYLFYGKGKPSTHIAALSSIADADLKQSAPAELKRVIERMKLKIDITGAISNESVNPSAGLEAS
jgi:energy-coupling factor transporter ATP-binding protein EcfA2